jgi:cold shock CspA family protein
MTEEGVIAELGDRNSGFIKRSWEKENLFFHADAVIDTDFKELRVGDTVVFMITESTKGPYATEVKRA